MRRLTGRTINRTEPRGQRRRDQARRAGWAMAMLFGIVALAGCGGGGRVPDVMATLGRAFGPALEGREAPPGSDAGYPSLSSVPERPARPAPGQRQALTDALAAERALAARPLAGGQFRTPGRTGTEGDRIVPLAPPRPAALIAAPAIRAEPPAPITPRPAAMPAPAPAGSPTPTPTPAVTPPTITISPGPPAPPPSFLAPGAGPPPPPSPDLLAPAPRGR